MEYGQGSYLGERKKYTGTIVLDDKLYLKATPKGQNEWVETFIPLEKIECVKLKRGRLEITVVPSLVTSYKAVITGKRSNLRVLVRDLSGKIGLHKKFLRNEWIGEPYSR